MMKALSSLPFYVRPLRFVVQRLLSLYEAYFYAINAFLIDNFFILAVVLCYYFDRIWNSDKRTLRSLLCNDIELCHINDNV